METLLKTKEDAEQFLFWVATLQSGVLPQGRGLLQTNEGYCCLGVGVVCFSEKPMTYSDPNDMLMGHYITKTNQPDIPQWLLDVNEDFRVKTDNASLSVHNDGSADIKILPKSHEQIADMLLEVYHDELCALL